MSVRSYLVIFNFDILMVAFFLNKRKTPTYTTIFTGVFFVMRNDLRISGSEDILDVHGSDSRHVAYSHRNRRALYVAIEVGHGYHETVQEIRTIDFLDGSHG